MANYHFLRYGTAAEQKYMKKYEHTYEGIALNASMLAHISKAISTFFHNHLTTKPFFIDPMTHAFQHDLNAILNSNGEIKSSIKKLIGFYGEPISIVAEKHRPIRSEDFSDENLEEFIKKVLDFQLSHIKKSLDDEFREYIEYIGVVKEPEFLIAPYFYMTEDNYENWLTLNKKIIQRAYEQKAIFGNPYVYAQLVIDKHLLTDTDKHKEIIKNYSLADGLLYWVDGFDESTAKLDELTAVKNFVSDYKSVNPLKPIISLYGGYFSELLLNFGLDGVVHGLEYGESRDVVPVGGGIPLSKFYLPSLKQRIAANTMLSILRIREINSLKKFHKEICDCEVCREIIKDDNIIEGFNNFIKGKPKRIVYKKSGNVREIEYPERESKERCLFHYLEVKNREFTDIKNKSKQELVDELHQSYDTYKNIFSEHQISYLTRWANVIEGE